MLKVGIIGVGTVGSSVANILESNKELIKQRTGQEIVATKGVVKNLNKPRDVNITLSDNIDDVLSDPSIDIVVELMGGVDDAYEVVKKALNSNKSVVTANKALLAYHRYDIAKHIKNNAFGYEASVAGGIPIVKALKEGLSANNIQSIKGIMNGTSNYMLTNMIEHGVEYKEILKKAQDLGYAEADPTFDVGGYDAAHKLLILASIAYNIDAKPEDILIEGIQNIDSDDILFAKEFNYSIKLLGIAKKVENQIELRMHPAFIPNTDMLCHVNGVMNAVSIVGDKVGESMYYGAGAGGDATASAVIADIIDIARGHKDSIHGYNENGINEDLSLMDIDDICTKYYVKIKVLDKPGVISSITEIFAQNEISIDTFLQRPHKDGNPATLLFATHKAVERDIKKTLKQIENLNVVEGKVSMIRIEES